jgi:hypothetical protein
MLYLLIWIIFHLCRLDADSLETNWSWDIIISMGYLTNLLLLALFIIGTFSADTCDPNVEISCLDDINTAYPACKRAAEEKGKDL